MIFMKTLYIITFCLWSTQLLATPEFYQELKSKIDKLENSIIHDFNIDSPDSMENLTIKQQVDLAKKIDVEYGLQTTLFFKIEEQLLELNHKLDNSLASGNLTMRETDKLKTSIEYANRIILKTRKREITEIYNKLMAGISRPPRLETIYENLTNLQTGSCQVENLNFNKELGLLEFSVKRKNNFGNWITSDFSLKNQDISKGKLTTRLDRYHDASPFKNVITSYWNSGRTDNDSQNFTLLQDETGKIQHAEFRQESEIPLVSFLGFDFGSQKVKKYFNCKSDKEFNARIPASVRNIER